MEQEESEHERGFFKQMKKKGVSFIPIKKSPKPEEHPLIVKWTPAFIEAQKDGIPIQHYRNPVTGENDITILIFDNRMLANTMPTDTILRNNMSMAQYHQLVEQAAKLEQEPSSQG
tara:strand:- start:441 stop:788 length:348 start_codon:yes stop_codon:yes gene_type:complete